MKFQIKKQNQTALAVLRKLGYAPYTNKQGQESYVRRIRGNNFPRFHLYINQEDEETLHCAVHLDQKAPSYSGSSAHGGDYESPEVIAEVERLKS